MMQLNVTPDFKKRSLKFKPEFPAAAKLESVELVIPNPDGEIKTAGLSFIIYSARCGGRKLAVCDAFTGTGTITGTLNLCTDRMVDEFYHLPLGTRRSFHAVLWSEADQWMIGAGRIAIANNPGSDSMNPAPLPADRYPTFEEVEEMIRNSGGLDEPVVRRVNGIAPDNAGNVSITIPGDVSELKDKDGLTLTVQQKNTLATLSTTYASKNHTHSEYALKSELPDVSGFITADKLNLYQLKADAFSGKYADLSGKPSAFPPASHTHAVADVNGLADELSRKLTVPAGGNAGQFLMKTVSGCGWSSIDLASYITITQARNEFAAKTHEHSQYALASALQDYAAKVHTHIIGDVTGLQDALDGKAAADHNHDSVYAPKEATAAALNAKLTIPAGGTAGQVIGKTSDGYGWITVSGGVSSWNDLTDKPSAFPPATHNHVIGDVTGLENKLNEKISSVNGQVPNSSGAVTLPVATSKADGLMSAADKEKLDGLDTTGSTGDMLKSVYDTDDDGIVDHAATADAVGATTAAQVADAVGKAHTHANKTTLDKLAEADGKLTYDGAEIGGGSGTVKSVNGQLPDESGNVTVETGGAVDESRLLPELATIPEELSGHPVVYDYQSGIDADTLCLLHLDDSTWADATGKNTITQHGNVAKVSDSGYFSKALDLSGNQSSGSLSWLTVPWLAEYEAATWTMEFFAKPTKSVVNFMFFSFGDSQGSYLSLGSQSLTNLWLGNGSGTYTGNFSFSLNTWYWFVIQYDGSAVKVYVDGQLVVQGNFTPNYVGQDLQFGNLNLVNNQDNTFIGYLDEFRWSKGLRYPTGVMTAPTEPYGTPAKRYKVSEASLVFSDSTRLLPENPANGDIPCFDATATIGGGNDANTKILLHFDADEIKDEAAGNAAPVTVTKKAGTITIVDGGKFDKCAQFVTGSMTVATNLDELNANNWV
uniref:LamG-like jellyroll fold domain-containing protein n=1 Tax=Victivallis vadensis TaxID=172901 RepID=UPI00307FAD87